MKQCHIYMLFLACLTATITNMCAAQLALRQTWLICQLEREIKTIRVSFTSRLNLL
jgi:hypothetical protein